MKEDFTEKELEKMLKEKKKNKKKRRMKTANKGLFFLIIWALIIQSYVMIMIAKLGDTTSLSILAGTAFTEAFGAYLAWLKYKEKINLKHMEKNYNPNYDEEEGLK